MHIRCSAVGFVRCARVALMHKIEHSQISQQTVCVFAPFITMALLNWRIVVSLRRTTRQARMFRVPTDSHKANARQSARIMVTMAMVYLVSNGLNVILTIYESLSGASMSTLHHYSFHLSIAESKRAVYWYSIGSDLVSILSVLGCASRLPIYLTFRHARLNSSTSYNTPFTVSHFAKRPSRISFSAAAYSYPFAMTQNCSNTTTTTITTSKGSLLMAARLSPVVMMVCTLQRSLIVIV